MSPASTVTAGAVLSSLGSEAECVVKASGKPLSLSGSVVFNLSKWKLYLSSSCNCENLKKTVCEGILSAHTHCTKAFSYHSVKNVSRSIDQRLMNKF